MANFAPLSPRKTNFFKQKQLLNHSHLCFCGVCDDSDLQEVEEKRFQWKLMMTSSHQDMADLFEEFVSNMSQKELGRMAWFLAAEPDYFMEIATTEYGSKHLKKLLAVSGEVSSAFCFAILSEFVPVMTDTHASDMAMHALRVWEGGDKHALLNRLLERTLDIACDQLGSITLCNFISEVDIAYYRNQLVDIVADNALWLSTDPYGNFVVQHVVKLFEWFRNREIEVQNISLRFRGHCLALSLHRYGSQVVKRLLKTKGSVVVVVLDLIKCEEEEIMRLVRSEYGKSVVGRALRVTHQMGMLDLFRALVGKFSPFA